MLIHFNNKNPPSSMRRNHRHRRCILLVASVGLAGLPCSIEGFIARVAQASCHSPPRAFLQQNTCLSSTTTNKQGDQTSTTGAPPTRESWDREAWANGFSTVETEDCYEIEGANFPSDLQGTFFQNGHSKFNVGDDDIMIHPFDGDGMISAVTIQGDGKAWFRNRFVQTPGYLKELETGKVSFRNMFGTTKNKGKWWSNIFDLGIKNLANTHVLYTPSDENSKAKLYALWEGGRPFEMDPVTLKTTTPGQDSDLQGSLESPMERYAAHYKIDADTGNVVNFAIGMGESADMNESHSVTVYEHDPNRNMKLLSKKKYIRPGMGIAHDVGISKNFLVMFQAPVDFDPLPWILGQKALAQCITQDTTATSSKLHLFPRDPSVGKEATTSSESEVTLEPITIDIPLSFTFHTVNAFESDDNGKPTLCVDVVMTDRVYMAETESTAYPETAIWNTIDHKDLPPYSIRRYTVDLTTQTLKDIKVMTGSWSKTVDFPAVHPAYVGKPYRYTYVLASLNPDEVTPTQGLCKVDVQAGQEIQKWIPESEYEFLTELVFVPRGDNAEDEDYGYLIGYLLNGRDRRSSQVVVFDTKDITQGPIARAKLKTGLAHALHGTFVPGYTPSIDEALSSFGTTK